MHNGGVKAMPMVNFFAESMTKLFNYSYVELNATDVNTAMFYCFEYFLKQYFMLKFKVFNSNLEMNMNCNNI